MEVTDPTVCEEWRSKVLPTVEIHCGCQGVAPALAGQAPSKSIARCHCMTALAIGARQR
jgi:hypothetical protein